MSTTMDHQDQQEFNHFTIIHSNFENFKHIWIKMIILESSAMNTLYSNNNNYQEGKHFWAWVWAQGTASTEPVNNNPGK